MVAHRSRACPRSASQLRSFERPGEAVTSIRAVRAGEYIILGGNVVTSLKFRSKVVRDMGDIQMKDPHASSSSVRPFLLELSVLREGEDSLPGRYDESRHVWVVDTEDGPRALVDADTKLAQTKTLTEVKGERPDSDICALPELSTKTATQRESDDQRIWYGALADIATTTKVAPERSDR